jgi:hypothetical protein
LKKFETETLRKSLIIVAVLATAFSSLTLWLIESWIKYPLLLFEILAIIVLYIIVSGYDVKLSMKHFGIEKNVGLIIDVFFIISASILLVINALRIQGGLIQLILALLSTSVLSGYALLNIFGLARYFSRVETAVLSYVVSFAVTGFITFASLPVNEGIRSLIVLSSFIGLGLVSALKHGRHQDFAPSKSFSKNIDFFALLLITGFYGFFFYCMYPGFALLPGLDVNDHYASSVVLWRTPQLYNDFSYVLAHLHEAAFIFTSNAPVTSIQTALATLNLVMPLVFYAMAKSYLEKIDARLPIISTIFFSLFSGFAWISLANLRLGGTEGSELSLLSMVNGKAYNGAMYFAQPFLWYVPLSVSFAILMIQLMLLRKTDISKGSFIALFSLLTVASYLTHVTEAVILSLFLGFYAFFSRSKEVRLDDALLASIIGFAFIDTLFAILQYLLGESLGFSIIVVLVPTIVLVIVYAYRKLPVQSKLVEFLSKLAVKSLIKALLFIISFIYLLGLVTWVAGVPSFSTGLVVDVGSVPWFIYPVLLGLIGILALASLYYFFEDSEAKNLLIPFIALIVFSLLFGRMLTFINVNFFTTEYSEKRLIAYLFLAAAVIAPISMVKLAESVKRHQTKIKGTLVIAALIGIVVIYGVQSSFMIAEYWNLSSAPAYRLSQEELQAISFLSNVLQKDKYAYTITLTDASYEDLVLAAPHYQLSGMQVFSASENPEMPLVSLRAHNFSHAYLYMDNRDYALLNESGQSWLAEHLLPILPVIFRNNEVTIYNVSSVSFPQEDATTALIVPFDKSVDPTEPWLYAYDALSLGEYNYTVAYDTDPGIFSHNQLVLSIDPPSGNILENNFEDNFTNENGWTLVSGTWQYTGSGLEAGKPGQYQDAIFLSPIAGQNFTTSVSFKPLEGDLKVENYVAVIYDWKDQTDYNCAELMFDSSGNVYAYFSLCQNGQVTNYPAWPGLETGLKWQFGNSFNLTVSVQGEDTTLNVNGTQYLSMKSSITGGQLGIMTTRFYQVLFTGFKSITFNNVQLRNVNEYLQYVEEGGKLIVLNTNGYGYFADQLLTPDNLTINAYEVSGSGNIKLPANLTISKFSPKTQNVEAIANYISQVDSSVYAAKEKLGSGEIIYVNIYPIIEAVDQSNNKASFYKILGELLKPTGATLEPFTYVSPPLSAAFRQVEMSGNVQANSSSLLFPLNVNIGKLEITSANNNASSLIDVKKLGISDYTRVNVDASNLTLSNGNGFYSTLKFSGNIIIKLKGNSTSMIASTADGNTTQFNNITMITIEDNLTTLYMRQPTITVQGTALFIELSSTGTIYQETQTQGQNLTVSGSARLTIYLSDTYSWASVLDASGSFERSPPILPYDELSSLPQAAFWSLILVPIFLIAILVVTKRELKATKH